MIIKKKKVKYKSMNEEFSMGAYEYSVTEAVLTKNLNYAYEIMNKDSADLIVNDKINAYPTGRVRGEREDFLWIKVHVKYDGERDFKTSMQTFIIKGMMVIYGIVELFILYRMKQHYYIRKKATGQTM